MSEIINRSNLILTKLAGLVIFNKLKSDPAIIHLSAYLREKNEGNTEACAESYASFTRLILENGGDFSEYLYRFVLLDDNIFIRRYFAKDFEELVPQLRYELDFLSELTLSVPSPDSAVDGLAFPKIGVSHIDYANEYIKALPDAVKWGVGILGKSSMFRVDADMNFIPVSPSRCMRLSDMVGYERERRRIVENTKALLDGKAASNVLLYGDAGTGKSSTVNAIAAEFANEGLRLIELNRSQISAIPAIQERISAEPLKFIIFIDDLTLTPDSPDLCTLKTVLEGGTGTERSNCVIYVTSNHRHLVKETSADRNGTELNVQDNLQGVLGLSARFGLAVTFLVPDKELYLNIVKELAEGRGIPVTDALLSGAEAFAIRRNGRSPRCAKQYIELVSAGIDPIK